MKVFLATTYTTHIDQTGNVLADYRSKVESIIARYLAAGRQVECDAVQAKWRVTPDIDPARALQLNLENIKACDELAVLLVDADVSAALQLEIGYGLAIGKRITLVTENGVALNYTNQIITRYQGVTHLVI